MAKYNQGFLGPFTGKLGTAVGSNWKGINILRSLPKSTSSRKSPLQLEQQAKFKLVSDFLNAIGEFIQVMYRSKDAMSGRNSALSQILSTSIGGGYPDYAIDYSQVFVAKGTLPNAGGVHASIQNGKIRVEWVNNSGTGKAVITDNIAILLYSVELNECAYTFTGARRDAQMAEFWNSKFNSHSVQVWSAFISADGKNVSPSSFLGQFLIN